MSTAHIQELAEYTGLNIASVTFLALTFRWDMLIPPPDRIVEWSVGLMVGVSILVLNIAKLIKLYYDTKNKSK
jgi:hypothetical protein